APIGARARDRLCSPSRSSTRCDRSDDKLRPLANRRLGLKWWRVPPVPRWSLDIECGRLPRTTRDVDAQRLLVGRGAECDVYVPDPRVSRQHFRLGRRGDERWIQDLGSRGGTRINGRPVAGTVLLAERDVIEISEASR